MARPEILVSVPRNLDGSGFHLHPLHVALGLLDFISAVAALRNSLQSGARDPGARSYAGLVNVS